MGVNEAIDVDAAADSYLILSPFFFYTVEPANNRSLSAESTLLLRMFAFSTELGCESVIIY